MNDLTTTPIRACVRAKKEQPATAKKVVTTQSYMAALDRYDDSAKALNKNWQLARGTAPPPPSFPCAPEAATATQADEVLLKLQITDDPLCPLALPAACYFVPASLQTSLKYLFAKGCDTKKVQRALNGQDGATWRYSCLFLLLRITEARHALRMHRRSDADGSCSTTDEDPRSATLALWFGRLLKAGIAPTEKAKVVLEGPGQKGSTFQTMTVAAAVTWYADTTLLEHIFSGAEPASTWFASEQFLEVCNPRNFEQLTARFGVAQAEALAKGAFHWVTPCEEALALASAKTIVDETRLEVAEKWIAYARSHCAGWQPSTMSAAVAHFASTLLSESLAQGGDIREHYHAQLLLRVAQLPMADTALRIALTEAIRLRHLGLFTAAAQHYLEISQQRTNGDPEALCWTLRQIIVHQKKAVASQEMESFLLQAAKEAHKLHDNVHSLARLGAAGSLRVRLDFQPAAKWAVPASAHAMLIGLKRLATELAQQEGHAASSTRRTELDFLAAMDVPLRLLEAALKEQSSAACLEAVRRLTGVHLCLIDEDGWMLPNSGDMELQGVDEVMARLRKLHKGWHLLTEQDTAQLNDARNDVALLHADLCASLRAVTAQAQARQQAAQNGQRWLGRVALDLPEVICGRGTLQFLVACGASADLTPILAAESGVRPFDYVQAYVNALAGTQRPSSHKSWRNNAQACQQLEQATPTGEICLQMLIFALSIGAEDAADTLLRVAKRNKLCFEQLRGPALAQLGQLLAASCKKRATELLALFATKAAQRALFAEADDSGDALYHRAARGTAAGYNLLALLSLQRGFCAAALARMPNAAGHTPLQEAALAGAGEALLLVWRKWRHSGLENALVQALQLAAARGQWRGLDAFIEAAAGDAEMRAWLSQLADDLARPGAPDATDAAGEAIRKRLMATGSASPDGLQGETKAAARTEAGQVGFSVAAAQAPGTAYVADLGSALPDLEEASHGEWQEVGGTVAPSPPAPWLQAVRAVRGARDLAGRELQLDALAEAFARVCAHNDLASPAHASLRQAMDARAWQLMAWLEVTAYGQYFGRHFCAHRPEVSDEALRGRLAKFCRYGSSRFTATDGVALVMLRARARKLVADARKMPGRYVIDLQTPLLHGCGYTTQGETLPPRFYRNSHLARAVLAVGANERVEIIALYPIAERPGQKHLLEQVRAALS